MTDGGLGSPSQPVKFYAPVPVLPIMEGFDDEEVDALIKRHFWMGMSRFELGQFLIGLGCKVDITKFERMLLQRQEQGPQHAELSTGRRCMMLQMQQISSWRSVLEVKWGTPCLRSHEVVSNSRS